MARGRRKPAEPETVRIDSLSHDGRGVCRSAGKVLFIALALPGELVRVQRFKRRKSHDEARLLEVLEASPDRVEPVCRFFDICGGCSLQHLGPENQIAAKQETLLENLRRIGEVEADTILPPLQGSAWGYRRRARLGARLVTKKGRVLVGFRERAMPIIADMHSCEVLAEPAGTLISRLSTLLGELSIAARVPQIEVTVAENMTALVFRVLDPPSAADLERLSAFAAQHRLRIYLQPAGPDSIAPLNADDVDLPAYSLPDFDLRLSFRPTDFIQVHGELNRKMVARAMDLLAPAPGETALDLFCGIGNFTLPLARLGVQVTGVEGDQGLVERARANQADNRIANAQFHVADLAGDLEKACWLDRHYDLVLLDPPRSGARELLEHFRKWRPRRVVYVSCHPGTLARDAGILVHELGYRLKAAGVMDMFPHTAHVESIAFFEAGQD